MLVQISRRLVISVRNRAEDEGISYPGIIFLLFIAIALWGSLWPKIQQDSGVYNLYVHQANAWLHSRLDIDRQFSDAAVYNGRTYVTLSAISGTASVANCSYLWRGCHQSSGGQPGSHHAQYFLLAQILRKLDVEASVIPWGAAAFFLGTAYWLAVLWSRGVWFFALVTSVTALFLAINEALGNGRGLLVGLFLAMAILSRQVTIYMTIFFVIALWGNPRLDTNRDKIYRIRVHLSRL